MTQFEQFGAGSQQFQPQGIFGGNPGGPFGGAQSGGPFGGGQIGQPAGGFSGGLQSFGAESGGGYQGLQQHPLLHAILQQPALAQQFLQSHPAVQAALQDPQAAAQLVQQHPLQQQALQHPLLARQIMQQHPLLHQVLQQRLMQQMQQGQQQQQQQPQQGQGGMAPQGWLGNLIGQYGQPAGAAIGSWLGNQGIGSAIGGAASQLGQMLPFGSDPYAAYAQQAQNPYSQGAPGYTVH
jgi:hypothetical protein